MEQSKKTEQNPIIAILRRGERSVHFHPCNRSTLKPFTSFLQLSRIFTKLSTDTAQQFHFAISKSTSDAEGRFKNSGKIYTYNSLGPEVICNNINSNNNKKSYKQEIGANINYQVQNQGSEKSITNKRILLANCL